MASLTPGTVVDRYRVQSRIGAGAMGEVYLALDEGLGRKVAVKILAEAHRDNPELRARFVREARAVAAISHPNVVQVFTTGVFDGRPFLAMELLAGRDLGSIVKQGGPLDSLATAAAARDTAAGLDAAARAGMIHRDVKPSNLMLLDKGGVKVTDFGLAKPISPTDDPGLTAMGVVVGTPDYIAPEQARGDQIDARVDIYALGCTMFYLLTGRPPFRKSADDTEKYIKVVARHLRDPAPDARDDVRTVDDELAQLALSMMNKQPDDRPGYDVVIATLDRIKERLARNPAAPVVNARDVSTRPIASRPPSTNSLTSVPPTVRAASAPATTGAPAASSPAPQAAPAEDSGEGALGSDDSLLAAARPKVAGWLVATTVVSALVFLVGLGLVLFGPVPARLGTAATTDVASHPPDAARGGPPPGMLAVLAEGGKPLLFVDRLPVSNKDYADVVPSHKVAHGAADKPVTDVSFDEAAAYARARGKRLLRAHEWSPALATDGFSPAGMRLWEWVDDGDTSNDQRAVRKVPDGEARHKNEADGSTTFRLALDAPRP